MISQSDKATRIARILREKQTLAEKLLWEQLRTKKLMNVKFRRQHPLKGYVVDFYCYKVNLVVELDGSSHDNKQVEDEFRQHEIMAKTGATFLRFSNEEVFHQMEKVLSTISALISERLKPN